MHEIHWQPTGWISLSPSVSKRKINKFSQFSKALYLKLMSSNPGLGKRLNSRLSHSVLPGLCTRVKHQLCCIIHRSQWADLLRIHSSSRVTSSLVQHAEDPIWLLEVQEHIEPHPTLCNSRWDKPSKMEVITLLCSDAALESLLTEFSLLCDLHTPLTAETDRETFVLNVIVFLFLLVVMPDAVASHAYFITTQHLSIAQDTKDWTFDTATTPSGHTWGSKGRIRRCLPACPATLGPLIQTEPLISSFMTSSSATHKQTHSPCGCRGNWKVSKCLLKLSRCDVFIAESALQNVNAPHHHSIKHDSLTSASTSRLPPSRSF